MFKFIDKTKSTDNVKILIISLAVLTLIYGLAETIYNTMEQNKKVRVIYGQLSLPVYYLILGFGFTIFLENIGFSQTTLFTLLGTFGLTLALSLQTIFTSIIAGIYIGFKNLFKIGDDIEIIDTNGKFYHGTVHNVDLFTTTIISEDRSKQIIPNIYIENGILKIKNKKINK